jgi:ribonuclease G
MNPRVSAKFTGDGARVLHALEAETGKTFHFEGSEGLPLDHFAITQEGKSDDIEERAIPFKEGDEVLVNIVEPHMYEVDDAVAKIDGYIISVVNGGRYVGTKKLVRIEEAGRTAAVATLLDSDDPDAGGEDGGDPESLESKPRRRGRRGGRRRSAAKAEATSE